MTLSAIHNSVIISDSLPFVVCDIGGYDFVSYSQRGKKVSVAVDGCL